MINIAYGRRYRRQHELLSALFARNPVLVLGLDLPFVIVCATTLKNAVALSIELLIIHMITIVAALVTVRFLPHWARMLVNVGISFVMMTVARALITALIPDIANYAGMYIYLMAVNGLTIYQCAQVTRKANPQKVLTSAFMNALAFSLTMLLVSLFREYFANGTLWGVAQESPFKLSSLSMPFGGFVLMAFLLAFAKFLNKQLMAFSIRESVRREVHYTEIVSRPLENVLIDDIAILAPPPEKTTLPSASAIEEPKQALVSDLPITEEVAAPVQAEPQPKKAVKQPVSEAEKPQTVRKPAPLPKENVKTPAQVPLRAEESATLQTSQERKPQEESTNPQAVPEKGIPQEKAAPKASEPLKWTIPPANQKPSKSDAPASSAPPQNGSLGAKLETGRNRNRRS